MYFHGHQNPEGRSRGRTRRYLGFRTTTPRRLRGQEAVSGRASPSYARNRGNGERGYLASSRRVSDLSTRLTALNAPLVRTRRCSERPSPIALLEDPPWGAWGRCSGKCRVCLWRRWKRSLPPKGSIRYQGSTGPAGRPRVGSSPRRGLHLNPRALPGAVEPPSSPGISLQGSLRRPRVQVFLQID